MKNVRLRILLEKTPLTEEDKYNIGTIFEALSFSRQQSILDNWEVYVARILELRKEADREYVDEAISTLKNINTLLDEAIIREKEKEAYKEHKKREVRAELESTVAYGQMQKLKRIKEVSRIPH
jgi:TRAP-type C4-dicarboxylate transport system substrate-binding protein